MELLILESSCLGIEICILIEVLHFDSDLIQSMLNCVISVISSPSVLAAGKDSKAESLSPRERAVGSYKRLL